MQVNIRKLFIEDGPDKETVESHNNVDGLNLIKFFRMAEETFPDFTEVTAILGNGRIYLMKKDTNHEDGNNWAGIRIDNIEPVTEEEEEIWEQTNIEFTEYSLGDALEVILGTKQENPDYN